jgi:hypothetical protein
MQMSKKNDDRSQTAQALVTDDDQKEIGLALTAKQGWLLMISILIFFITLLFFGYKDWQRQRQMSQEFEEHLRAIPTSKADEEKRERGVSFLAYASALESPHTSQKTESRRI